jgi:uncharacterized protein YbbC (DUF1343 family)
VSVCTGLERLLSEGAPQLEGLRIGLVTNPTGVDTYLRSAIDLLVASEKFRVVRLFGPEHGIRGEAQAGVHVEDSVDERTGLLVHSLYGDGRKPSPDMLKGLDALVFDIQDIGVRFATYVSTLFLVQEAAAEAGLLFIVLDRPNPITGVRVEGNLVDSDHLSFVGIHPMPIRHGLTFGELACLFAAARGWPRPVVVPMLGWRRDAWFDQTGLRWVLPSPNLPTLDSVTVYPGTCLVEGTNVSEGRGTTRPFELVGAPWIDPFRFADELAARELPGVAFRAIWFTPTFSKHQSVLCGGVQIHVLDREALRPVELGVHLLHTLVAHSRDAFAWRQSSDGAYFVDRLLGDNRPRQLLDAGASVEEVLEGWTAQSAAFAQRSRAFHLYA